MKHELVKLPYGPHDLEPAISAETLSFHHGKHLQGYVDNLNKLIEGTEFAEASLEDIVRKSQGAIFNNAGQTLNHNLYFTQFAPNAGGAPTGKLLAAIEKKWGSFEAFQAEFLTACTTLFGSGWAWLACDDKGELCITKEPNGSNPVVSGLKPLMGIDVWEHAYYLSYQNRRADHIKDVWNIIDWNVVAERY
ncbi:MAG: superoxide dismutase [Porphyromonadaceae bacterium]|nr:superoxide dismutase [Porphyromonadaceae bacterium]